MSEVLEVVSWEHDPIAETVYVKAYVSDAVMIAPATLYAPEQWGSALAETTIFWPGDFEAPKEETSLLPDLDGKEWTVIPFDEL